MRYTVYIGHTFDFAEADESDGCGHPVTAPHATRAAGLGLTEWCERNHSEGASMMCMIVVDAQGNRWKFKASAERAWKVNTTEVGFSRPSADEVTL
jgi:hypothetical protein